MKEDFLHYLWLHKKFHLSNLFTAQGEQLAIIHSGFYLQQAGPDFFNAQLIIGQQKWAGSVEIHLKSSDWYVHQHEKDQHYDNVILHVVWEHDLPVFRKDNTEIPVLVIKQYVAEETINKYQLLTKPKSWINCEKQLHSVPAFVKDNWLERLFFDRLERKSKPIQELLKAKANDWEAVLFCLLAQNFGLNTNGESFARMAQSIPFSVIRKESFEVSYVEALLFGQSNLLSASYQDNYAKELQSWYDYLVLKYKIDAIHVDALEFFKHRPDNFPTIRLAQLAMLYHVERNLFSKVIEATSVAEFYGIFAVSVSSYWKTHYTFDKISPKKEKGLSRSFIDLLIMNTIIPLQFAYRQSLGNEETDILFQLVKQLQPEKNTIIEKFAYFGWEAKNAFESQSLLQLKKELCNSNQCMRCAVGIELIKK